MHATTLQERSSITYTGMELTKGRCYDFQHPEESGQQTDGPSAIVGILGFTKADEALCVELVSFLDTFIGQEWGDEDVDCHFSDIFDGIYPFFV